MFHPQRNWKVSKRQSLSFVYLLD